MTHFACYDVGKNINAVIHIHNKKAWSKYKDLLPTTPASIRYGTLEMASYIKKLTKQGAKVIVMGGHEDGLIFLGQCLDEAGEIYLKILEQV